MLMAILIGACIGSGAGAVWAWSERMDALKPVIGGIFFMVGVSLCIQQWYQVGLEKKCDPVPMPGGDQ